MAAETCDRAEPHAAHRVDRGAFGVRDCPAVDALDADAPVGPAPAGGTCGATDPADTLGIWRCTKPSGHTGDRHVAENPIGTYCWGYVPADGGDPR